MTMKLEFILLENLTSDFEYPCIMDLKMGTRLHDDHATQTKKQSHESKVNETTSGALGLRVTGIQVSYFFSLYCFSFFLSTKNKLFRSMIKKWINSSVIISIMVAN